MFKSIDLIVFICLEILASPHTIWGRCDSRMNRTYQCECIPPLYVCMCVCVWEGASKVSQQDAFGLYPEEVIFCFGLSFWSLRLDPALT